MKLEPANMFCPVCGDGYHMYHLIGEDIEHLDLKCTNCNSYFNLYELLRYGLMEEKSVAMPYNILKPMTNADRIRTLTDEELAELVCDHACMLCPIEGCEGRIEEGRKKCKQHWLDWLKREVDND